MTANEGKVDFSAEALRCQGLLKIRGSEAGLIFTEKQIGQFGLYYDHLVQTNRMMNLTALTEPEDVAVKHFIDSLYAYDSRFFKGKLLIDVGTGAGFPGVPLKIQHPELELVLLDSLAKRLKFLQETARLLDLQQIHFEHMRAEDAGHAKLLRGRFDLAVSRAVARLPVLAEYCLPLVKEGGYVVALKGSKYQEEITEAKKALQILGGQLIEVKEVRLPGLVDGRAVIYIKKVKETPALYPRRAGVPGKAPLGVL